MEYEVVIGLEVHAELQTQSKMFCSCPVVDATRAAPNSSVCPVCGGLPGVLPVVNRQAVDYALRVALALECQVAHTSLFARKNYFYPDLPKGYQISQYEFPLAENGRLFITPAAGERLIRIRRVHLEEDTGKLTHLCGDGEAYSLVDLNRAGVPLLEIVSEPDLRSAEEAHAYGIELRSILRYLGANSGDMEKGVIRFEANVSLREAGSEQLGTRVEIKNLNSFRALERSILYEVERQKALLERGEAIRQETLGWDEANQCTFSQRGKEEAHDYRYFPEPDLPPLVVEQEWIAGVAASLPELPRAKARRLAEQYRINPPTAKRLVEEMAVADFFEQCAQAAPGVAAQTIANWMLGELFGWLNASGESFEQVKVSPAALAELLAITGEGVINFNTAKTVFTEMLQSGLAARQIIAEQGLQQISDAGAVGSLVEGVLQRCPQEVASYLSGKETVLNWLFGQVMRAAGGQANPQVVRAELQKQLEAMKTTGRE